MGHGHHGHGCGGRHDEGHGPRHGHFKGRKHGWGGHPPMFAFMMPTGPFAGGPGPHVPGPPPPFQGFGHGPHPGHHHAHGRFVHGPRCRLMPTLDTDEAYVFIIDAEGVKSRDLAVEIVDNRLRVVFTKDGEVVSKRFFRLDEEEVVVAGISAKLARGELTLTVPKIPKKRVVVPIEVDSEDAEGEDFGNPMADAQDGMWAIVDAAGPSDEVAVDDAGRRLAALHAGSDSD